MPRVARTTRASDSQLSLGDVASRPTPTLSNTSCFSLKSKVTEEGGMPNKGHKEKG